jgi:N-6 DNA Methylase
MQDDCFNLLLILSLSSLPSSISSILRRELPSFGVQKPVMLGDGSKYQAMNYLDLIAGADGGSGNDELLPDAVAECQGRPLLYVISNARLGSETSNRDEQLRQLRRTLGSRGERAYLGILEPGQLTVIPVNLSSDLPTPERYVAGTGRALTFFSRLSLGEYDGKGEAATPDYVYDEMLRLLQHVADELADGHGLMGGDVLSLVGRALFFRFLCDRDIVKPASRRSIAPDANSLTECFETVANIAATSAWLDSTFNGDFLRLIPDNIPTDDKAAREAAYGRYFAKFSAKTRTAICHHLSAILHGHQPAGASYQMSLDAPWAKFDFAHVPVGLLSQVYEAFSWRWSDDAKENSVHYTPRRIADYLVEEAFHALPNAAMARVLDPACGAGVFLVLAFRKLYQERWKAAGGRAQDRPDRRVIREILNDQLAGFDVSENALRLASLSLYLTAIELDPQPVPPSNLRFKNLDDRVLFNCRRATDPVSGPVIGSLGDHVGPEHRAAYDVVLCNPPWTSLEKKHKALAADMDRVSREIIARIPEVEALAKPYQNPDSVPDLPFVWRSTEWCRPEGRIGLVLPGRNLFKQGDIPSRARETLFRAIAVNGILNCSNLSDTKVWPGMNQPFFLMFACNRRPKPNHALRWVTPHCDVSLNRRGEIRVDSESVHLINVESTFDEPWLWKALAIGTSLDVDVVRKVFKCEGPKWADYWEKDCGLISRNGYQIKAKQKQRDASFLKGLPDLKNPKGQGFVFSAAGLGVFTRDTACFPREKGAYQPPLVLVKGFPGPSREEGWAIFSSQAVAYNQCFFGYSAAGHPEAESLTQYLHLFVHSAVWAHLILVTSPKMGAERREFYKSGLDNCPIIPWHDLSKDQRKAVGALARRLMANDTSVFPEIDDFFGKIYGLTKLDAETIQETLEVAQPFGENRESACQPASLKIQQAFAARLSAVLRPFVRKHGSEVTVSIWNSGTATDDSPYGVLQVGITGRTLDVPADLFRREVLPLANESGASRVIFELEHGLAVAVLNQRRYWTLSRARLCAAEIINRHMGVLR